MNQPIQDNPFSDQLSPPSKRRRGRPRKDPSKKSLALTKSPPGFGGVKEKLHPINEASDGIVGHTVTGVVDASFDAGYLLSVRIGNSICRGVVFKPAHIAPVTVENDVAPHAQVIKRNDVHVPPNNSIVQNGSSSANQWLGHPTTNMTSTTKGKYASPVAPSVFPVGARGTLVPVGARGTLVPVVLQPPSMSSDFTPTPQLTPTSSQDLLLNDRVYTVEPLAMIPAASSFQTPVSQSQPLPSQIHVNEQGVGEGVLNGNISSAGATMTNLEEVTQLQSAEKLAQDDPRKGLHDHNLSEYNMSYGHPSQSVHPSLPEQSISVSQPLVRYPTGKMTELLLALQENVMENQMHGAESESPSSSSSDDHDEESGD